MRPFSGSDYITRTKFSQETLKEISNLSRMLVLFLIIVTVQCVAVMKSLIEIFFVSHSAIVLLVIGPIVFKGDKARNEGQ